jgi:hypothetical protein
VLTDPNNYIHMVYIDASGHTMYREYTTSWQTAVTLDSNAANYYPTITINKSRSNLLSVFWIRSNIVYYKYGNSPYASGNWLSTAVALESTGTNTWLISNNNDNSMDSLGYAYTSGTGSPYSIKWGRISYPTAPSLDSPADATQNVTLYPALKTTGVDPGADYLRYKIDMCTDLAMTNNCQTFDETSSQTGWSGQNTQSNTAYTYGTQATYTIQTKLNPNTNYYWRSYGIDPGNSNIWSNTQTTPYNFKTKPVYPPEYCTAVKATNNANITLYWVDPTTEETGFYIERSVNGGAYSNLTTKAVNSTSHTDTGVSAGSNYAYRIRTDIGSDYSTWCLIRAISLVSGEKLKFGGVKMDGIIMY